MKTLHVSAKEWFDKTYGNSYFSAQITIDFGYKSEQTIYLPWQYGYDDHYLDMTLQELIKLKKFRIKKDEKYLRLYLPMADPYRTIRIE